MLIDLMFLDVTFCFLDLCFEVFKDNVTTKWSDTALSITCRFSIKEQSSDIISQSIM